MNPDDGTSFSDADEAPDHDATTQGNANAPSPTQDDAQAGAHPIPDEPATSTGQAAVPAPDTNAESLTETE